MLFTDRDKLGQCYPSICCVLDGKSIPNTSRAAACGASRSRRRLPIPVSADGDGRRRLAGDASTTSLDVDDVHSYMPNALGGEDLNLPASGAISATNPRPVPTLGRVVMQRLPITKSWYDAMEMQIRQRVRGGNNLQLSYTLSRALIDGVGREATPGRSSGRRWRCSKRPGDRSSTATTRTTRGTTSRSRRRSSCRCAIQMSAIDARRSARPLGGNTGLRPRRRHHQRRPAGRARRPRSAAATCRSSSTNQRLPRDAEPGAVHDRPDQGEAAGQEHRPPAVEAAGPRRGRRIELFAEAFNLTNFVNVTGGAGNIRLATFNVPTGAQDARQIQWGARYAF